jgi:hypothetical protein
MTTKTFKSAKSSTDVRTLGQVAADVGRILPSAVVRRDRKVLINVKVSEELAIALAEPVEAEEITLKQAIAPALAVVGLPGDPFDLEE